MTPQFKSGYVALLGKPNVGKSTLLNALIREPLAIVSPKPQTTRDTMRGIVTTADYQIIFVDTPGIHRPRNPLGEHMVAAATEAAQDADLVLVMVDATTGITAEDRDIFRLLKRGGQQFPWAGLVVNKIDLADKSRLVALLARCQQEYAFQEYFPVSSRTGENVDLVRERIVAALPPGPAYFPAEHSTDRNERFFIAEYIREQTLHHCHEEIPHAVAVLIEEFKEQPGGAAVIQATIFVERDSQKMIIIGKGGSMLKAIGIAARRQSEALLQGPVYLDLRVKVHKNWRKDPAFLKRLGYAERKD